jgi:hypothetical protein
VAGEENLPGYSCLVGTAALKSYQRNNNLRKVADHAFRSGILGDQIWIWYFFNRSRSTTTGNCFYQIQIELFFLPDPEPSYFLPDLDPVFFYLIQINYYRYLYLFYQIQIE